MEAVNASGAQVRGICDIYSGHLEKALSRVNNPNIKSYRDYTKMLENKDIDAIIIATPDHLHAQMTIDAAEAGKDIYVEKCMTRTIPEAKAVVIAVKRNKRVLQLGHGGRSSPTNIKAAEIYNSGRLGKVTLVRIWRSGNSNEGLWINYGGNRNYSIPPDSDSKYIDWNKFLGSAPKGTFDMNRYFHWRCYWDYGTGIAGDLLSHSFDQVNQIMRIGIPETCVATGGIYYWDDGREVPDVFNVIYDYPSKGLAVTWNSEFNNSYIGREMQFLGKNATLESFGRGFRVFLEPYSDKNREILNKLREKRKEKGENTSRGEKIPAYTYSGKEEGLYYTNHMQNFIDCVQTRERTRCNEDDGFEEVVSCIMSVIAYKEKRMVKWDKVKQEVI